MLEQIGDTQSAQALRQRSWELDAGAAD
jgi:hypothetical protein